MLKPFGMGFDRDLFRQPKMSTGERIIKCTTCKGTGEEHLSDCCLAEVKDKIIINGVPEAVCTKCGEPCNYIFSCDTCNGKGEITKS